MRLRIPYTGALPAPRIVPAAATTPDLAAAALARFLRGDGPSPTTFKPALVLTGAGLSTPSGLADYRGANGTYTLNAAYRPVFFGEFLARHAARRRYWARSFLGWPGVAAAQPNRAHAAVARMGEVGWVGGVVTQNVDALHQTAHFALPTLDLHGSLTSLVCTTCDTHTPRATFQAALARLNPPWAALLRSLQASGALATENPAERRERGLKTNPDGDVDAPGVEYESFRYPPCGRCLERFRDGGVGLGDKVVEVDADGAARGGSTAGVLKPAVVMFGESIATAVKDRADGMVDAAGRLLVVGSSLATYSAWRLVKRARGNGVPVGVVNLGGVRGEAAWFGSADGVGVEVDDGNVGLGGVRVEMPAEEVLPRVVELLDEGYGRTWGEDGCR